MTPAPLVIYAFLELLIILLLWVSGVQGAIADQELAAVPVDQPLNLRFSP